MRKRVGALIIRNKSLLLVSGKAADYFWSPGGTIESNESDEETLKRELDEELGLKLVSAKLYKRMKYPKDNVSSNFYLVNVEGDPQPAQEVSKIIWYTKSDFENQEPRISSWISEEILPDLIKDGYL